MCIFICTENADVAVYYTFLIFLRSLQAEEPVGAECYDNVVIKWNNAGNITILLHESGYVPDVYF